MSIDSWIGIQCLSKETQPNTIHQRWLHAPLDFTAATAVLLAPAGRRRRRFFHIPNDIDFAGSDTFSKPNLLHEKHVLFFPKMYQFFPPSLGLAFFLVHTDRLPQQVGYRRRVQRNVGQRGHCSFQQLAGPTVGFQQRDNGVGDSSFHQPFTNIVNRTNVHERRCVCIAWPKWSWNGRESGWWSRQFRRPTVTTFHRKRTSVQPEIGDRTPRFLPIQTVHKASVNGAQKDQKFRSQGRTKEQKTKDQTIKDKDTDK